jgi:DNA-binding MarR family transcriptional regulator
MVARMEALRVLQSDVASPTIQKDILAALRRIIRAIELHSRQLMQDYGLTGPQLATLQEIARTGGCSPGDLASELQVSQATITGILDRLEKHNLVRRTRNGDDRRGVDVSVTEPGVELLETAPPLLQDRFCQEFAQLQNWEQNMLLANLQRIAAMMNAADLDAAPHLVAGADRL